MPRINQQPNPLDARYGAFDILQRVEQGGYADRLLDLYLQRHPTMDARERGLLTELVYGVELKQEDQAQTMMQALSKLNNNNKVALITGYHEVDL